MATNAELVLASPSFGAGSDCPDGQANWFCIRAQPKREHIATAALRQMEGVEVFCPRIRFRRSTSRGPVQVTEALFPGYLFARFDWNRSKNRVQSANGVSTIVHFGDRWPVIPRETICTLQEGLGGQEVGTVANQPEPGSEVTISGGLFHGLVALVTYVIPSRERLRVLINFLGRLTPLDLDSGQVVIGLPRQAMFRHAA